MEARFGPLGAGRRELRIAGLTYTRVEALARLGLAFEGCRSIDALELGPERFAVRYYDPEAQQVVAQEFDAHFRYLSETRVHVSEWVGEEAMDGLSAWSPEETFPPWTSS